MATVAVVDRAPVATPEQYHSKNHRRPNLPVGECWQCLRARAICRSKLQFTTREEADAAVASFNADKGWETTVARYPCRWCPGWHMTTTRGKVAVRRAERARRKTLWKTPAP